MTYDLRPYPAYKDSGVPWLGEVPAHWDISRIKNVLYERDKRSGSSDGILLSLTRSHGLVPRDKVANRIASVEDLSRYKVCEPGDLVMNRMQAWSGMFGVPKQKGLVSPDYSVFGTIGTSEVRYFSYLFKTPVFVDQFAQLSKGIGSGFNRLYTPEFGSVSVIIPPYEEQLTIARFLDHIDRLTRRYIRAQRRLIALLEEQKQALIQRAVTRGLDPDVPLKDSGIEWLEEIPTSWSEITIRHLSELLQTGPFGSQLHAHEYVIGGTPVINPSHMSAGRIIPERDCSIDDDTADRLSRHQLEVGDIVFARRGDLGRCALVGEAESGWICGTGSMLMRPNKGIFDSEYLLLVLSSQRVGEYLTLYSVGATMQNLNTSILAQLRIPRPPFEEQRQIANYVTKISLDLDRTVDHIQCQIDLVREYHTRLIADVVTGKLDVRDVSLPDLDEVEEDGEYKDLEEDMDFDDLNVEELNDAEE
jgi:type I restriction enzyme S subunit